MPERIGSHSHPTTLDPASHSAEPSPPARTATASDTTHARRAAAPSDDFSASAPSHGHGRARANLGRLGVLGASASPAPAAPRAVFTRLLAQVRALPLPPDPRTELGRRPEDPSVVIDRMHHEANEAIVSTLFESLGSQVAEHGISHFISHQLASPLGFIGNVPTQLWNIAQAARRSPREGLIEAAHAMATNALEFMGNSLLREAGGELAAGAYIQVRATLNQLQGWDEVVEAARNCSAWDARHAEIKHAERHGRESAECTLQLLARGEGDPDTLIDPTLLQNNRTYFVTLRQGLENLAAGRAP
jgi:hypothetical protein